MAIKVIPPSLAARRSAPWTAHMPRTI